MARGMQREGGVSVSAFLLPLFLGKVTSDSDDSTASFIAVVKSAVAEREGQYL